MSMDERGSVADGEPIRPVADGAPPEPVATPRARRSRVRSNGRTAPGGADAAPPRTAPEPSRFVAPAVWPILAPAAPFRLRAADRALVRPGEPVEAGQPIIEQFRDVFLLELPARDGLESLAPGQDVDLPLPAAGMGRHHVRPGDRARLLYTGTDGIARLAVGRSPQLILSPIDGIVEELSAGRLVIRAGGIGLRGQVGWGEPVRGRLLVGVASPEAELRASAIDIGAAGSILLAGARLDIEALTRARAIGVAGIICGGLVGRELKQLEESDLRQRAVLHTSAPFAVLTLDGFGRRPVPILAWDLLSEAAGCFVGVLPDARLAVISGDPASLAPTLRDPSAVRITAGEGNGRIGRLVGLAGPLRRPGGMYQPSGYVQELASPDGQPHRRAVPLADLERLG
jgi:hypothetical protein